MSELDQTKLEEKKNRKPGGITARCPACSEHGHDKTGNHLVIWPSGKFGCIQFPGELGVEHRKRIFALVGIPDPPAKKKTDSPRIFSTLDLAIAHAERQLEMKATRRDTYHSEFVVARFDNGQRKEFRPFCLCNGGWAMKDPPGKLPLFNLPQLRERPQEEVVLVEGEKCACEFRERTGLLVTTSAHGAKSADKSDWSPLAGRKVVILPDNDSDGTLYAEKVSGILLRLQATVKTIKLPGIPPKGDCVEWLQGRNGQSQADIAKEFQDLATGASCEINNVHDYVANDNGNARMFVDRYGETLRYIHAPVESWFLWDGNRWAPDAVEGANHLARKLSDELIADSVKAPGRRDETKLRRGIEIGDRQKISSMLWLARSDPRIVIKREEIDADNFLLGARNGVIDLRTGQRRDGRKGDFITKSCGCNYDAAATAPRWRGFLKEIFNEQDDLVEYIKRLVGYSLTGVTREQCLVFLYGSGANGKSTFIETLVELLGDYATTASQNILCFNKHVREPLDEIASLEGARFVSIAETGESRMAEVRIKQLTGGDTVTGKAHYQKAASFRPKFKLWIFGNSRPSIYGVDYAMWRRIKLIPFNVQFPVENQDSTLKEKLLRELPGILNWAIEGALAWQSEGRLVPPECVVKATNEYREDEDVLLDFIAEKIKPAKGKELAHKELYAAYKEWHAEGSSEKPFPSKKIAQMLRDRGYKTSTGRARSLLWWGIGLKESENGGVVSENTILLQNPLIRV